MVKIDDAVIQLVEREGLLSWLYTILQNSTLSAESYQAIAQILEDVTLIMNRKEQRRRDRLIALPDADKSSLHVPRRWVSELCACVELLSEHSGRSTPCPLVTVFTDTWVSRPLSLANAQRIFATDCAHESRNGDDIHGVKSRSKASPARPRYRHDRERRLDRNCSGSMSVRTALDGFRGQP